MPGAQYRKIYGYYPPLGVHDDNGSMKYTKLLAIQIKGFVLRTVKAIAYKNNF